MSRSFLRCKEDVDKGTLADVLFVMTFEILCIKLRNSNNIYSFKIGIQNILLSLYADDCSIFLEYNTESLRNSIKILNDFYITSGLQIQISKTQCVVFGKIPENHNLSPELGLRWEQEFKLLGANFNGSLRNMEINFEKKLVEIKSVIQHWQYRFLSPIIKRLIIMLQPL